MTKRPHEDESKPAPQPKKRHSRQQKHRQHGQTAKGPSKPTPLNIPEVLLLIASFLPKNDLKTCLRVCKLWYQTLLSSNWSVTELSWDPDVPIGGKTLPMIGKHSTLINTLVLHTTHRRFLFPGKRPLRCPNLSELEVRTTSHKLHETAEPSMIDFILQHQRNLTALSYDAGAPSRLLESLAVAEDFKALERLSIRYICQNDVSLDKFMQWYDARLSRLRSLSLDTTVYLDRDTPMAASTTEIEAKLAGARTSNLRELRLSTEFHPEYPLNQDICVMLLRKSPDLLRLRWSCHAGYGASLKILAQAIEEQQQQEDSACQRLKALELLHVVFRDEDFKAVLESLPVLTELSLQGTNFDFQSWETLKEVPRYMTTLKTLDIRECRQVKGSLILTILSSISSLETFSADYIEDSDLIVGQQRSLQPWVCLGLKKLTISVYFSDPYSLAANQATERTFHSLLSKMEQLEELDLNYCPTFLDPRGDCYLKLTLAYGLDELKSLKRLRVLKGPFYLFCWDSESESMWTAKEGQWVKEHWKELNQIRGFYLHETARAHLSHLAILNA
ncbi:hypothetical protein BGZ83_001588 [Gryganskiella cystojenkinii]|nr:hypothetical protein BGZ83_001588 [Gryganskiella cystojenkinii]